MFHLAMSLILAAIPTVDLHGYNACFVATDVGWDNLNSYGSGLRIDSTRDVGQNLVTNRNVFRNGYLYHNDWDGGGFNWILRDDTLFVDYPLPNPAGMRFENGLIVEKFFGVGAKTSIRYDSTGFVMKGDDPSNLVADSAIFTADSMRTYYWNDYSKVWSSDKFCTATATACTCTSEDWTFFADRIEERRQGSLFQIHYISGGEPLAGIGNRAWTRRTPPDGTWRIDGSRRAAPRSWMPRFQATPGE